MQNLPTDNCIFSAFFLLLLLLSLQFMEPGFYSALFVCVYANHLLYLFLTNVILFPTDGKHSRKFMIIFYNLFIKHLEELDVSRRPLHCSDVKREIIHIRDKNNWEKDNDQKLRLTGIATDISRLNTVALQGKYQQQYPHCLKDTKSKEHNEYGKIAYEAFGGKLDLDIANKKFFRNIFKIVAIDKANYR